MYETLGMNLAPKVLLVGVYLFNDLHGARDFERWWTAGGEGAFMDFYVKRLQPGLKRSIITSISPLYIAALVRDALYSLRERVSMRGKTIVTPSGKRLRVFPGLPTVAEGYAHPERMERGIILEVIERIQVLAQQNGTRCLIVFFPSKEEVYLPVIGEKTVDLASYFIPELERRGISYLDLGPEFRRKAATGGNLFFEDDPHPNVEGNALIADVVLAYLKDHAAEYGLTDSQNVVSRVPRSVAR
jgi:hypothetical protein